LVSKKFDWKFHVMVFLLKEKKKKEKKKGI